MNSNVFTINLHAFQLELIPLNLQQTNYSTSMFSGVFGGHKKMSYFQHVPLKRCKFRKIKSKEIKNLSHLKNAQVILTERDYFFLRVTKK